ncbi:MAG: hypothetical protein E5V46_00380, partial [Mesorhizobium sp.]
MIGFDFWDSSADASKRAPQENWEVELVSKTKRLTGFVAACALTVMSALPAVAAGVPESKDPLKLVMMGYSGDNIIMFIYGKLLQKLGYTVEWTPADYLGQFAGIETGDLTIGSPGWDTTAKAALKEAFATGKVLNMGDMGIPV